MSTEKELKAMNKAELKERLEALGKALEQDFPTSGTNDELRDRIVTAQEMLAQKQDQESAEVEGDSTGESYFIIRARAKTGFYRCGKFWPHEGRKIKAGLLSDDQIKQLKAEKHLIVEQV